MAVFTWVRIERTKVSYSVHADNLEQAVQRFNDGESEIKSDERLEVLTERIYAPGDVDVTEEAADFDERYWDAFTPSVEDVLERQAAERDLRSLGIGCKCERCGTFSAELFPQPSGMKVCTSCADDKEYFA